ncbi:hypothetical protein [Yersinia massiliensis]|uniref:Uncharacterized protein n=1 Tax=Yersinia massiliensis TaxID=419257 RepID=A0ABM6UXB1_9GAMM|nr:hypothetical protein [Yersinia massiliensis]AVX39076.1 hypothetical protein DA391_16195 [Yersinia massiliensis]
MSENTDYETLKAERDAALNACSLIAEALGITGAVAGDTIAKVRELVAEKSSLYVSLFNHGYGSGHHDTVEGNYTDIHRSDITTYHDDVVGELVEDLLRDMPATTQALNEIKAQGAIEFAEFLKVQAKESLSRGDHYVFDRLNAQAVTAERFAASLRGNN